MKNAVPISGYVPGAVRSLIEVGYGPPTVYTGNIDGKLAWSNGIVAFVGPVPVEEYISKQINMDQICRNFNPPLPRIIPMVADPYDSELFIVFDNPSVVINARYYDAALAIDPKAKFFGDARCLTVAPVSVYHPNGERFGLIMSTKVKPSDKALEILGDKRIITA